MLTLYHPRHKGLPLTGLQGLASGYPAVAWGRGVIHGAAERHLDGDDMAPPARSEPGVLFDLSDVMPSARPYGPVGRPAAI